MEGGDVSIGEDELEFKETLVTALKKREKTMLMKRWKTESNVLDSGCTYNMSQSKI